MSIPIILPQWGMGMNEGQVMKWLKSVGDPIQKGDKLVEIESSKVNSEVEATSDGILGRIDVEEEKVVNVGTVLGYILVQGETDNDLPAKKSDEVAAQEPDISQSSERIKHQSGKNKIVTPRARRLAKKLNVNIDQVEGTGSGGRITEEDITNFSNKIPSNVSLPVSSLPVTKTVKLERLRSVIAKRMTESSQIPTVTLTRNVDVTSAVEFQRI